MPEISPEFQEALDWLNWLDHPWIVYLRTMILPKAKFLRYQEVTLLDWCQMCLYYWENPHEFQDISSTSSKFPSGQFPPSETDLDFVNRHFWGYQCENRLYLSTQLKTVNDMVSIMTHEMTHLAMNDPWRYQNQSDKIFSEFRATLVEYWSLGYSNGNFNSVWAAMEEVCDNHALFSLAKKGA